MNIVNLLKSQKKLLVIVIVAVLGFAGYQVSEQKVTEVIDAVAVNVPSDSTSVEPTEDTPTIKQDFNKSSAISPQRRVHILQGDATGGGHMYGIGKPCKSEFPKHWDEDTIIKEVELIAANDNLNWEQQRNGYYVTEQKVGTVKVRVVKGREGKQVITAYPTNLGRNPCPANDNY